MPEQMSPAQVDTKLGKGASAAGWTGKLYGVQRVPNYFHKIAGKQNSAKDAKAARVRLLDGREAEALLRGAQGDGPVALST